MKKVLSLILSITMLLTITSGLNLTVYAADYTGQCGDNAYWTYDKSTATITISGTGAMWDSITINEMEDNFCWSTLYYLNDNPEYPDVYFYPENVVIENGITNIPGHAFGGVVTVKRVSIGNTVESIGYSAFAGTSLEELIIPESVSSIGIGILSGVNTIKNLEINGTNLHINADSFFGYGNHIDLDNLAFGTGSIYIDSFLGEGIYNRIGHLEFGDGVKSIGSGAFRWCKGFTNLYIPESVSYLGGNAFEECCDIETVNICGDNLEISNTPFINCNKLKDVLIGNGVTTVGPYAFSRLEALETVYIGNDVKKIDEWAFEGCETLRAVLIGCNVESIGESAFGSCESLETLYIPSSVISIGSYAFSSTGIEEVIIPNSVTNIGSYAFTSCTALERVVIPDSVAEIGEGAFSNCVKLKNLKLSKNLTNIPEMAFEGCKGLTEIVLAENVNVIDYNAFLECRNLSKVYILNNGTIDIYSDAFYNCTSLSDIYYAGSREMWSNSNISSTAIPENSTIHYNYKYNGIFDYTGQCGDDAFWDYDISTATLTIRGTGAMWDFQYDTPEWNELNSDIETASFFPENIIIESGITGISNNAFSNLDSVKNVSISNTVKSIGNEAFSRTSLEELIIPESVSSIGNYILIDVRPYFKRLEINGTNLHIKSDTFGSLHDLDSLVFGTGSIYIDDGAFGNFYNIDNVEFSNSVKAIGDRAFAGVRGLGDEITIPRSVSTIGYGIFTDTEVKSLIIYGDNLEIPYDAFSGYNSIETVQIRDGVTKIGDYAFCGLYNDHPLKSITISDTVTEIGESAFEGCINLKSVSLGNNIASIGEKAFAYTLLESITIPDKVEAIEDGTFEYCEALKTINFSSNLKSIGERAFGCCFNLTEAIIPDTVETIGGAAFACCTKLERFVFSNSIKEIPPCILQDCNKITEIILPTAIEQIHSQAFYCTSIKHIDTGINTKEIYDGAFEGCSELETVIIHKSVNFINPRSFEGCNKITDIYYTGSEEEWNAIVPESEFILMFPSNPTVHFNWVPTHIHRYGEWSVDKPATCTEVGIKSRTCTSCGDVEEVEIEKIPHNYTITNTLNATCTANGFTEYTCTSCGVSYKEPVTALNHAVVIDAAVAPSCTKAGLTEGSHCSRCNEVITAQEVINPLGHDYRITSSIEPTCTQNGYINLACDRDNCNDTKRQLLAALGHSFGDDNVCDRCGYTVDNHKHSFDKTVIEPTCTDMGYTINTCNCGYTYNSDYIEQKGHRFDDGVIKAPKTCTASGVMEYTCSVCGAVMDSDIPAGHEWSEEITIPATCTENGEKRMECSACGLIDIVVIPAGHKLDDGVVTREPDCENKGEKICTCTVCGAEVTTEIDALGHHYVDGVCTICGEHFIDNITTSAHPIYGMYFNVNDVRSNYGPDIINEYGVYLDHNENAKFKKVAVYLTQDGTMWRRCIACTGSDIDYATYVPYLSYGADIKYTGLNSDCINIFRLQPNSKGIWCYNDYTTIGVNLEDYKGNLLLSLCDIGMAGEQTRIFDNLDEMKAWLADEHYYGEWTVRREATCDLEGIEYRTCNDCGDEQTREIPKLTHDYECERIEPTCTKAGSVKYTCKNCGAVEEEEIEALNHNYVVTASADATCSSDGYIEYTCTRCDDKLVSIIDAIDHKLVYDKAIDATCTEKGYSEGWHCSECDYKTQRNEYNALGHKWGDGIVTKQATEDSDGEIVFTCTRCQETMTEVLPRLEHTHTIYVASITKPTCTEKGYTTYVCGCGESYIGDFVAATGHSFGDNERACLVCGAENPNYIPPQPPAQKPDDKPQATDPTQPAGPQNPQPEAPAPGTPVDNTKPAVNPTPAKKPKAASLSKLTKGKKQFKVVWKKVSGVTGYQIQYSTDKKFKKGNKTITVKGAAKTTTTIKKLKSKKTYYVRIRTYNGKSYSAWSKVKSVKTK